MPDPFYAGDPRPGYRIPGGLFKSRVEGENHLPQPAGYTSFEAAQDTVDNVGEENCCLKEKN